ncbi:MAG: FAD-containing oxidoreductase [Armatimonadaceae bacterium]
MHYDIFIIGAGQAALPLAQRLIEAGKTVAVAERRYLGGSCVNFGCTPTKAVIASARLAHRARRGAEFGLRIPTVEVDFPAVMQQARDILHESRQSLADIFPQNDNLTLLRGHARLTGREGNGFRAEVIRNDGVDLVSADTVVLDTGTRARIPSVEGLDTVPFMTADNWIENDTLPERLLILGGGYIGVEMSQFYRRMGSEVVVIDENERFLSREDEDAAHELYEVLKNEGIAFHFGAKAKNAAVTEAGGITLTIETESGERPLNGTHLLVVTGRIPNTEDLGLDTVGVRCDDKGVIETDKHLQTSVEGIFAVGDIRGGPMFTHTSWDDYRIVYSRLMEDGSHTTDRIVPHAIFTDPQLAQVGLTESEARKQDKKVQTGVYRMERNGQARESRETHGFAKVVVDAETQQLLGATVLSDEAAEVLHIYVNTMNSAAPYTVIRDAVYTHPTLAEAIQSATQAVTGEDKE